jgi:lipopolysaccharide/colanic/teichoic acid biosynthesis glycosyltransferase
MITTSNLPISLPAHLPVLEVDETQNGTIPVHPSVTSSLKRLIDFLGALIGLGVTAIVAIPVALALARQSRPDLLQSNSLWSFRTPL